MQSVHFSSGESLVIGWAICVERLERLAVRILAAFYAIEIMHFVV